MTATRVGSRIAMAALGLTVLVAAPRPAAADAIFVVNNRDPANVGFNDPTAATPVGGNTGTTIGQQRQIAFQYAADIWGKALDSRVPIVVDAQFAPLDCSNGLITLGHARARSVIASVPPGNVIPGLPPNILFPQPLADRLAGVDLDPGVADIVATFNGGLNDCDANIDWYYGLDAKAGGLSDLVEIVVHELGHGLGFSSGVDPDTGEFNIGIPDTFSMHIYDNAMAMAWVDMTSAQRRASMLNVRHLVWTGDNAVRAAAQVLAKGSPTLSVQPLISAFTGPLGETNFGPLLGSGPALSGPLVIGNPISGCAPIQNHFGGIYLLQGNSPCSPLNQADYAARAGAIAVLLADGNGFSPPSSVELPPDQLSVIPIQIPVVGITIPDAQLLLDNASRSVTVSLSGDGTRLVGADAQGRPFLYASDPIRPGSTVSHWDPLARPDLVQEPESGYQHPHDVTMETALMHDIGWLSFCGNGQLDSGEECDNGTFNSDAVADACRTTCTRARCGDGVPDSGEACDLGARNGQAGTACTATCTVPSGSVNPPPDPNPTPAGGTKLGCACAVEANTRGDRAAGALVTVAALAVAGRRRSRRRRAREP